jgi:hypothetical protein
MDKTELPTAFMETKIEVNMHCLKTFFTLWKDVTDM